MQKYFIEVLHKRILLLPMKTQGDQEREENNYFSCKAIRNTSWKSWLETARRKTKAEIKKFTSTAVFWPRNNFLHREVGRTFQSIQNRLNSWGEMHYRWWYATVWTQRSNWSWYSCHGTEANYGDVVPLRAAISLLQRQEAAKVIALKMCS